MSKNKECVRCGGDTGYLLKSLIVSTHQVCINCFEEEMIEPKKAKQRLRKEKLKRLGYTQEYLGGAPPERELSVPQSLYLPRHLSHPVKPSLGMCCYQRFDKKRLTSNPNLVTCLRCLKHIRSSEDGEGATVN
jgi:hypothetical protein